MAYSVRIVHNGQTHYVVSTGTRLSLTVKPRNATEYPDLQSASTIVNQLLDYDHASMKAFVLATYEDNSPIKIEAVSWRNEVTAPFVSRSRLYTFTSEAA